MISHTIDGYTFYIFYNHQLNQDTLNNIQRYIPGWYPAADENHLTVCIENHIGNVGIYQIEKCINLFTICPKFMHNPTQLQAHMRGILEFIHHTIKDMVPVYVANEVQFKIAFYRPPELEEINYSHWYGHWRFTKVTMQTICGGKLTSLMPEYVTRWSFDQNYNVKTNVTAQWNL